MFPIQFKSGLRSGIFKHSACWQMTHDLGSKVKNLYATIRQMPLCCLCPFDSLARFCMPEERSTHFYLEGVWQFDQWHDEFPSIPPDAANKKNLPDLSILQCFKELMPLLQGSGVLFKGQMFCLVLKLWCTLVLEILQHWAISPSESSVVAFTALIVVLDSSGKFFLHSMLLGVENARSSSMDFLEKSR